MKKITSALIGILFIALAYGSADSEDVKKCDTSSEGYRIGYKIGEKSVWDTPEEDLRMSNNGFGNIGEVPPCWEEGFRDAKEAKNKEQ